MSIFLSIFLVGFFGASPPTQPADGPAGTNYPHGGVTVSAYLDGDDRYWIYEPADPAPDSAPVLLYLHGYGSWTDQPYEQLLTHVARKGYIVIYPRYGFLWNPEDYEDNAVDALLNALEVLESAGHVNPEYDRFAIAGHSLGGILTLRIAHRASFEELPTPRALVIHDGVGINSPAYVHMPLDDLSGIPDETLLALVIAQTSLFDPNAAGVLKRAWLITPQIPRELKNAFLVRSDDYGDPDLVSDHLGVLGWTEDAIDWYGYWKPLVAAMNVMFYDEDEKYVLGNGPEVHDMGSWSDLQPVKKIITAEDAGF